MYKPKHFKLQEFVSKDFYDTHGERAWNCLDERMLMTADALRERFGTMTINNWVWGGGRQFSGLRTSGDQHYSPTSQHSYGRAFDAIFSSVDAETVRQYILSHPDEFPHIRFLEADISWLHIDVRNTGGEVRVWSPTRGFLK